MPNWCENRVTVSGDVEDISKLKEFVKSGDCLFSFQAIKPMPEELEADTYNPRQEPNPDLISKYGTDNWYDWRLAHWGCKWDNYSDDVVVDADDEDFLIYRFDTPWGPPNGIYETLTELFPDVSISWFYDEPGMGMAGYLNTD